MPVPPLPPPLDELPHRRFSFYPPVLNAGHNEWVLRAASWNEIQVRNTKSFVEVWIPRGYLGQVSRIDEPLMILGLSKELEFRSGAVWPHERRVIEMPRVRVMNGGFASGPEPAAPSRPAAVIGIKLESKTESRLGRLVLSLVALGLACSVLIVSLYRGVLGGFRAPYRTVMQSNTGLTGSDDYESVVRRYGRPREDREEPGAGGMLVRILNYRERNVTVVLMGSARNQERYVGALDPSGQVIDSVALPGGGSADPLIRAVRP